MTTELQVIWEQSPFWANWATCDYNGDIFFHQHEPYLDSEGTEWISIGEVVFYDNIEAPKEKFKTMILKK